MSEELRQLNDRPFDLLLALEERLRTARLDYAAGQAQYWVGLGFRLGSRWLVAPREDVREVILPAATTRVPNARPWLLGVSNVRGSLLPVIDLAVLTGNPHSADGRAARVLVFNSERVPAGFLVDEVAGYRQFEPADQRHERLTAGDPLAPYLLGAFERDGREWQAFSLHKVAASDSFKFAGY